MIEFVTALRSLPYVHPMIVHFPVVLLLMAAGLDVLEVVSGRERLAITARWALWLGTLGAALAVWTGHESAEALEDTLGPAALALVDLHHDGAIAVLVAAAVLSVWRLVAGDRRWRRAYLVLAIVLAAMVAVVSHLGGQLVYLHGVAVRPPS
jgi:uncharacterized membrane protein